MAGSSQLFGLCLLLTAVAIFLYYTLWVFATVSSTQPFVSEDHFLHHLYPARHLAIRGPQVLLCVGSVGLSSLFALMVVKARKAKKD